MNRTEALRKLTAKQTASVAARWIYRLAGAITHPATEAEPWTCGRMTLTREHRTTGVVRHVAAADYADSAAERDAATARAEELTQRWTAFDCFADLLRGSHSGPTCGYRPSLRRDNPEARELADLYDAAQVERGDPRRAYRS